MKRILSKPSLFYLLQFAAAFAVLYFGTLAIIGLSSKENMYSPFVARYLDYISPLRYSILYSSNVMLRFCGYSTIIEDVYTLRITGGQGVRMVYSCVGYGVLCFWASFIIANTGSAVKKIAWLLCGWLFLWMLNVLRIFFLVIAVNKNQTLFLGMDHHTLFTIVAYGFIFLMIYFYDLSKRNRIAIAAPL